MLKKWENAVRKVNQLGEVWKATRFSHICSHHFERLDYTISPSSNGTCRLKQSAVPSVFFQLGIDEISEEVRSRLELPRKRPLLQQEDTMSSAAKVPRLTAMLGPSSHCQILQLSESGHHQ